ncbi:MAG: polyprenyl synthetase family protein [Patescibacteria group bacterium]|jgi:geranylgeranyl diphosphate synthase type I
MMTLGEFKEKFDIVFSEFIDSKLDEIENVSVHARSVLDSSRAMWTKGGKRIRPYLSMLAYQAHGGEKFQEMLFASCALELLHIFALVHDDVIDQSDTRRGFDTLHVFLSKEHNQKKLHGDAKHIGESLSILIGDLLFSYANEIVTRINFPTQQIILAQELFYTIQQQLVLGEYEDVRATTQLATVTEEQVLTLMSRKSGRYTIEQPLQFGTILSGKSREYAEQVFRPFSEPLGVAFQLHDDILGTFGDEQLLGKPTDSDIKQGKPTLMVVHALKHTDASSKERLLSILGNQKASTQDIEEVCQILRKTKSDEYAKRKAADYIKQAHAALSDMKDFPQDLRNSLAVLADFIISRTY